MTASRRTFRSATEADLNALSSLTLRAYPIPKHPVESVRERLTDSPWSTLDDVQVGEDGGELAAFVGR